MMENINETENQGHADPGSNSLDNTVSRLERQIAEQQDQLRDYEKSLVDRIADVDDDRRTTASQLQRAWQSQLEELNERFRKQMVTITGVVVLFLVVIGAVLFFAYHQANSDRQLLADELAALKQELTQTAGTSADADSVQAELTRLSAAVGEISASHPRQDDKQVDRLYANLEDERLTRDKADAVIDAEVQRLETRLGSLVQEVESLRESLVTAQATKAEPSPGLLESVPVEDTKQDSVQEPAATAVEQPEKIIPANTTEGKSGSEDTAVVLEQPFDDEPATAVTDANSETETPKTLILADRTYALQLIGYNSLDSLLSFADREDLPQRLFYREETVKGQPWFALIHSLHPDYASAYAELQKLSPELVALEPWIRSTPVGVELTVFDRGSQR